MRVAIRDHASEKVGSANQFIEIPNLKKNRLTLSSIVLNNLTYQQWDKPTTQANTVVDNDKESTPLADTALRIFKRGTVLRYGFEIYNAKSVNGQMPQLTTQTRVFRDGKLLFEGKPQPVNVSGQTNLQVEYGSGAINLGSEMETGDYILQIIVTDNLAKDKYKITTQFVQFEIQ